jgi:hypothetical protein
MGCEENGQKMSSLLPDTWEERREVEYRYYSRNSLLYMYIIGCSYFDFFDN